MRGGRVLAMLLVTTLLAGCGIDAFFMRSMDPVGCTLMPEWGKLEIEGGNSFLRFVKADGQPGARMGVRWPRGWRLQESAIGMQVVDTGGRVQATEGDVITVYAQSDNGLKKMQDGFMLACDEDVRQGAWPPQP